MGKLRNNQSGFSAVEAVLILVIVGLVGFVGWYVYNAQKSTDKNLSVTNTTSPVIKKKPGAANPKPSSKDPYAGWKSYCDSTTGNCFKYPTDWSDAAPLDAQGVKALAQNKAGTISIEYSEPVDGTDGLNSYVTSSLDTLTTANSLYKVVGGYYTTGNIPGYNLADASQVQRYSLVKGKTSTINSDNQLFFTNSSNKATLTAHYNNTTGTSGLSASQADAWFNSADGKTALLIVQSYYKK